MKLPVYKDVQRGSWYVVVRYQDCQGNHKQKMKRGFATRKTALAWEREFLQKQSVDLNMQFQTFAEVYFRDKEKRLKERSFRNKKYMFAAKITPFFGKMAMDEIKSMDILNWQNEIMDQGYSETYQRMLQNQLTAIFNHAERFYGLKDNPCKKVDKLGRSNARELSFWTLEEFEQFIKSFGEKELVYITLFNILFWTGCRIGEVLALTPADIDLKEREIRITKTYYRHERQDVITAPKTEKSIRTVTIPDQLCRRIGEYQSKLYGLGTDNRLFEMTDRAVQKAIVRHAELAGVKRIRVHDLRHSHVALLIERGISPLAIAERVGHESINTTMNVYGHLYPNKQREIAKILDQDYMQKGAPLDRPKLQGTPNHT